MRVLVVNAGSSSLKLSLIGPDDELLADHEFEVVGGVSPDRELASAVQTMKDIDAVGHRVVHGGSRYPASTRVDSDLISYLVSITDLAPLHMSAAVAGITTVRVLLPRVPAVACIDTAFHLSLIHI